MSEVKRYWCDWDNGTFQQKREHFDTEVVKASAYDAAQSELAALREELAEVSGTLEFNTNCWGRERAVMIDKTQTLTADLLACGRHRKAAEQRNAELVDLLTYFRDEREYPDDYLERLEAATKPTESGASE